MMAWVSRLLCWLGRHQTQGVSANNVWFLRSALVPAVLGKVDRSLLPSADLSKGHTAL